MGLVCVTRSVCAFGRVVAEKNYGSSSNSAPATHGTNTGSFGKKKDRVLFLFCCVVVLVWTFSVNDASMWFPILVSRNSSQLSITNEAIIDAYNPCNCSPRHIIDVRICFPLGFLS
jgi:hypothetical protein